MRFYLLLLSILSTYAIPINLTPFELKAKLGLGFECILTSNTSCFKKLTT
ncbi:hypothetical protein AMTRI_Chr03g149620 [Amborella trichopoda]